MPIVLLMFIPAYLKKRTLKLCLEISVRIESLMLVVFDISGPHVRVPDSLRCLVSNRISNTCFKLMLLNRDGLGLLPAKSHRQCQVTLQHRRRSLEMRRRLLTVSCDAITFYVCSGTEGSQISMTGWNRARCGFQCFIRKDRRMRSKEAGDYRFRFFNPRVAAGFPGPT